ncbi:MAG TPA: 6-bladed beta-propeller [Thermodesulfovibrionales bacterium]|nr:6-bladed beta-propeller [Thermodesulfovibrionales bacterium]
MNRKLKTAILLCIAVYVSTLLTGCAPPAGETLREIVWPLPPEKPRIKWLGAYMVARDIEEGSRFLESLVGVDPGDRLQRPQGVTVDASGNIYTADTFQHKIFVFDLIRRKLWYLGEPAQERPIQTVGLAIAQKSGFLLSANSGSKKVVAYDLATGRERFIIGNEPGFFSKPVGVAVDEARGRIYVTDSKLNQLRAFDMTGKLVSTIANGGTADNQVYFPAQVYVDREGKVYVADSMNFKVKIFRPDGSYIRSIGSIGITPGHFSRPYGVAVDSEGHIYVSDANFGNVQVFDQEGRLLLTFGGLGKGPGQFNVPMYIWIDKDDKIYVTDSINMRVQVFQYLKEQ